MSKFNIMSIEEVREAMQGMMIAVNTNVTLQESNFTLKLGDKMYNIVSDLKMLQGKKEPFFNASYFVKKFNEANPNKTKAIFDWTRSKRFNEIIDIWERENNVPKSKLYRKERVGGKYQIFVHHELFLSLLIWLDAEHEMAITNFINRAVEMVGVTKQERKVSKGVSLHYTDQLKELEAMLKAEGSGFAPHTYTNIQRWVYEAGTGRNLRKDKKEAELAGVTFSHDGLNEKENHRIVEFRLSVAERITVRTAEGWTGKQIKDDIHDMLVI
ncbi:KilA-N domain-containing protein [Sulfurovum sp. CS9]|uniref:KilA-N domain-containing protein n=1 Tax=Sulfurovum sp. CS9 TaxID=3391146 RepID=UPI0039EAA3FA